MLFKPDPNGLASDLSKFVNLNPNTAFATVEKFIKRAEKKFIIKEILGSAMYQELDRVFNDSEQELEEPWKVLFKKVQDCLANYALFLCIDQLHIKVSDLGIVMDQADEVEFASLEEKFIFKKEVAATADEKAENLLEFLEENTETFLTWTDPSNPAYSLSKELVINSAREFTQFVPMVGNSRRVFRALRPAIRDVEELHLMGILGAAFFQELKSAFKSKEGLSDAQQILWKKLQKITAYLTISEVLPLSQVKLYDGFLVMPSFTYGSTQEKATTLDILRNTAAAYQEKAQQFINLLLEFLNDNLETYPSFKSSSNFISQSGGNLDFDYGSSSVFPI